MFIEADAELEIKVYSNLGKLYVAKIPTTVECWAESRIEECHGYHHFDDIDDVSYNNAVQEAEEAFDDLEYAEECILDELAEGEYIVGFLSSLTQDKFDYLDYQYDCTSAHVLHD